MAVPITLAMVSVGLGMSLLTLAAAFTHTLRIAYKPNTKIIVACEAVRISRDFDSPTPAIAACKALIDQADWADPKQKSGESEGATITVRSALDRTA